MMPHQEAILLLLHDIPVLLRKKYFKDSNAFGDLNFIQNNQCILWGDRYA